MHICSSHNTANGILSEDNINAIGEADTTSHVKILLIEHEHGVKLLLAKHDYSTH